MTIDKDVIRIYALENAIKHKGSAQQGAVLAGLFSEGLKKENVKETLPLIQKTISEINSLSIEEQEEEYNKLKDKGKKTHKRKVREEGELPPLPNLDEKDKGKIVMRFAPFPSGPLHIGNARQLILNDEYCKKYDGKLILVMDDTIGSEAKPISPEAYDLIEEGVKFLDIKYDKKIIYKSDRIEKYYSYAEEMIKKGYMYVCSCSQEEMREKRAKGVDCSCRHLPIEEQIKRWEKMFLKSTSPGDFTVRLKTDMNHPNPAFRDRVMFRISDRTHPRTKNKFRVYPLLEFSWAIDDHLLGITHIIRGIDLMMETKVEKFIWDIFKWPHPTVVHTGFLAIEGIKISKSKGAQEVRSGEYIGWNDPRTWSLQSLRDRGINPKAIRDFILNMGITKSNSTVPIDVLYAINKKYIDESPRYFFIPNPIKIKIKGTPKIKKELPLHPNTETNKKLIEKEKLPKREYETIQEFYIPEEDSKSFQNQDYRLMHLLTFNSDQILKVKPREFSFVSEQPSNDKIGIKNTKFLQWLPANEEDKKSNPPIKVKIRMPNNEIIKGLGENSLKRLKENQIVNFERFGYCKLQKKQKKTDELEFWFTHP